jgi:hypothetical protein
VEQRRTDAVLARLRILLDETNGQQRAHDPVHGPLGKAQFPRDFREAEPPGSPGQQAKDRRGSFDGLDRLGHGR